MPAARQIPGSLQNEALATQSGRSTYENTLQECLTGELRLANAGLPQSQRRLSDLLNERYPHAVCNDGSAHFFRRSELEYLGGILDTAEQEALLLPMLIQLGPNEAEAVIPILSAGEGELEEKVISDC